MQDTTIVGAVFEDLSDTEVMTLIQLIYTAADSWIGFEAPEETGLVGLMEVVATPFRVVRHLLLDGGGPRQKAARAR